MKVRDSGMPVKFGSGYGTFSLPIARHISGTLFALDLETELIHRLKQRAESQNVNNITATEMCPLSTMRDLHQLIVESDKVLTF